MGIKPQAARQLKVVVGIGEFRLAHGSALLSTCSLGSCVGIVLYDQACRLAGLAHCMLPDLDCLHEAPPGGSGKCVATALPHMIERILRRCQARSARHLQACLVGGAAMFALGDEDPQSKIGYRNVAKAEQLLAESRIPIVLRQVGANYGRGVQFAVNTGLLTITTALHGAQQFRCNGRAVPPGADPGTSQRG
ncbi:MAG: chemotaxis protein CheD [Elusimicrobia bacterium]|nr:chemotaxis protein CheD [Elusimicrobiota bacterium]